MSANDLFAIQRKFKDDEGHRWAMYYFQLQEIKEGMAWGAVVSGLLFGQTILLALILWRVW